MAADLEPEKLIHWTFILTMIGTVLFVAAVAVFIL